MMELERAVSLLQEKLDIGAGCETVGQGPLGPAAVLCKGESKETFTYLWQEPSGDWSIVTQVSSGKLVKAARLSRKFEKLVTKASRDAKKGNAGIEISDGKIVAMAAFNNPFTLGFMLEQQEEELHELINSLHLLATKKLKLKEIFEEQ